MRNPRKSRRDDYLDGQKYHSQIGNPGEKVLASKLGDGDAAKLIAPLFGIYELRLADAHPSSEDIKESFKKLGIDPKSPHVMQGRDLLHACVSALIDIAKVIKCAFHPS